MSRLRFRALTVCAVLAASCGSSSSIDSETGASAPPASASVPIAEAVAKPAPSAEALARLRIPATGDLEAIRERRVLRVLVAPSHTHYAVIDGLQRGDAVDAGAAFEALINEKLPEGRPRIDVVFISTAQDALVKDLMAGIGDIAANLLLTFERDELVAFSTPIRSGIREVVVTGPGVPPLISLEDVAGRSIHVRRSSDHYSSLVRLNGQLKQIDRPPCQIVLADERLTDEDLLRMVNDGKIGATLVDDYVLEERRGELDRVAVNRDVAVSQDAVIAWATRKESIELLAAINEFFATHKPAR